MAARKLTDEHKVFIVIALATYKTPSQVVEMVRQEYEVEVKRQSVHFYDPTTKAGEALDPKLKELFFTTRKAFEQKVQGIGIALQSYRLRELHELYVQARKDDNPVEARSCLEQAAKEVGGMFTNKRTLTIDAVDNARAALDIMREEFRSEIEAGSLDEQQLVAMVAEDHGVDPVELGDIG